VLCASKANVKNVKERDETTSKMTAQFHTIGEGEFEVKDKHPVDVVVGTPMKLMKMVRGRGWDLKEGKEEESEEEGRWTLRRGRDKMIGFGQWKIKPEMGLANVEWVIIDEDDLYGVYDHSFWFSYANYLSDPDFQAVGHQSCSWTSCPRHTCTTNYAYFPPIQPPPNKSYHPHCPRVLSRKVPYVSYQTRLPASAPPSPDLAD